MGKENELNFQENESDISDLVEKEEEKITASITDSAHVQTVNPVTESGGFQQEVNENITRSISSIISGSTKIKTITSSINTINSTMEGGATQKDVNESNKQNIDDLNSQFDDVVNGNTSIKTITSSIETISSTSEGGATQKQVNEKNKQNIDDLNDSIAAIDDKVDNLDLDINTSKINANNSSLENGSTQQEINIKNKVNFDSLNSGISDINDKMESFGEINTTSSINAVDTSLEGGINQKEINEVNKTDIDNISTLIEDISSKIDDYDIKTNTENVSTIDGFFEGGPTQKEVNESNKKSIFTLNTEIIKVNSEITEINDKIDCLDCGCDSGGDCDDITTSTINTSNSTAEGGSTQAIVNENNKAAIDNLNDEFDTLNDEVDDLINNGGTTGNTSTIDTVNAAKEGGSTQQEVNEANKEAIDDLNDEVDDLINNGTPAGNTSTIDTANATAEGGSTQEDVNKNNKAAIDNLNDEFDTLNEEVDDIINNGTPAGNTSTIDTVNTAKEGGATQQEVNEANKEAIDDLNDEVDDLINNGTPAGNTSTIDTANATAEGGSTQEDVNKNNKAAIDNLNDEFDTLNEEVEDIINNGTPSGDTSTVDTVDAAKEGGSTQQEVNEANKEAIDDLNDEVDDLINNGTPSGNTSTVDTVDAAKEGGATQQEVNEANKEAIDDINDELDDLTDPITSGVTTVDAAKEGGSTQQEVNEANKEAIDDLNDEVDDLINNGTPSGNTSTVDTVDAAKEGGSTQQEVNEANKEAIDDLNDEVDDLINNGTPSGNTSTVDTVDAAKEGGSTQQEVNEANKEAIDDLNDEVDDLINNGTPSGNTSTVDTVDPAKEGGSTQQEVNEANKEAIDDINDELDGLTDPITSGVSTVDPAKEGGSTQQEVNEANKEAIDDINDELDGLTDPITSGVTTVDPAKEGGSTQQEVNEANKDAIDDLNDEVDDLINNGTTPGNTSTVDTTNPELEGGSNQEEVNEANKEAIDDLGKSIGDIWADLKSLADCTDCPISISSAVITNVVTVDNKAPDESEGTITFDVNISNFLNQGTVSLNPAENTSPMDLTDGDNIGLVFTGLPTGTYTIEVYDGPILATKQDDVIIKEPTIEIEDESVIDGMGDGAATGSGGATVIISGYDCVLTAILTPDPNSANPFPLVNGTNKVLFNKLPPGDYTVDIKCDDDIIDTFDFTIHDGPIIPDNDGMDDLVGPVNPSISGDGTANYNFVDYNILITRIDNPQNSNSYNHALDIGTNMEIGSIYHLGNNGATSSQLTPSLISLTLSSEIDYTISIKVSSTAGDFKGINFIKGYKKEITPLLDAEANVGLNGTLTLKEPASNFKHIIIKSTYNNSRIEYALMSLDDLATNKKCFLAHHDLASWTWAVMSGDYLSLKSGTAKNRNIPYTLNMVWGLNIDNLQDLTGKTFDPRTYSIIFAHVSSNAGVYLGIIATEDIITDGKKRYYFLRWDNGDHAAAVIFKPDGTYSTTVGKTPNAGNITFRIVKLEGLILPPIKKGIISNVSAEGVSGAGENDGSITFDVSVSAFDEQGTAVLDPASGTEPINLNAGDNNGLIFENLPSALYKIRILDGDELITLENNIVVPEPEVFASNPTVIDSMGNGTATGSASTKLQILGFNSGNAIINPNPNNINPVSLNNGNNEVIFDNLPPNDYNLEVKNNDNVIKRFSFKINDDPTIPINDGLSDLAIVEDEPDLIGGTTQDNLTDYSFLFVNILINNSEYGTTLLLGNNLKIEAENYNLGHEWTILEIASRSQEFLTLKLNKENNYSLDHAGDVYNGVNFIKGYKKEITPLLDSEIYLGKGKASELNTSIIRFDYIITKSTLDDTIIEYNLTSVKDLSLYNNKYWAGYGRLDNLYVNVLPNNKWILVSSDGNTNSNYVNMLWGVNFDNIENLTDKIFNPKVYTFLLVHFNLNDSAYVGLVYTANVIADGKTKYYLTIINVLTYIIFNQDGTYTLSNIHNFTKIEGVSLNVVAKANIKNIVTNDATVNSGNDGSIKFDVNISAFSGKGTAVLNPPTGDNLPIDLNDGDNVGLSFINLTAGTYTIEIYEDENLITKREDIIVSEPVSLLINK